MAGPIDHSYRLLAAKYVRKQAKQLGRQLEGVRKAEDAECVHQVRVASRRLRAALRMFDGCFDAEQMKRWWKETRRARTRLGEARDKDVQIEYLCDVMEGLDQRSCYPGIARLMARLERQRQRLQPRVIAAAERLEKSGVLEEMRAVADEVVGEARAREVGVRSPFVLDQTRGHILGNLGELLSYEASLADRDDHPSHHAMRIAAKRLRYTVEICGPVYEGRLSETTGALKDLQTLLGEVHDCDVWVEDLARFAAKERKRVEKRSGDAGAFARLQVGIEYLQQDRRQRRAQVFGELVDYWQQLVRERQWERLEEIVREGGLGSAVPRPTEDPPEQGAETGSARNKANGRGAGEETVRGPHSAGGRHREREGHPEATLREPAG